MRYIVLVRRRGAFTFIAAVLAICIASSHAARAQDSANVTSAASSHSFITSGEAGIELYLPTHDDRQIRTINANASLGATLIDDLHLYLLGGITATCAWGSIRQSRDGSDTVMRSNALGVGPYYQLRWVPITIGSFSLQLNAGHGLILYSEHFPAGGDIYNFMFRVGPDAVLRVDARTSIAAGYRWMHVSNGQGLGTFNPSYEGSGASIAIARTF